MRDECTHGSLHRKCEICRRDEDITELRSRAEKAEAEIAIVSNKYQSEVEIAAQAEAEVERLQGLCADILVISTGENQVADDDSEALGIIANMIVKANKDAAGRGEGKK